MAAGFMWQGSKTRLMHLIKNKCGIYSIKLPLSDEELFQETIALNTVPTFSTMFPLVKKIPVDLNQIRIKDDRESSCSDLSDVYRIPKLFSDDSGRFYVGIEKVTWFNDMRYQAINSTYETIESYQALAIAQGVANLASTMEPAFTVIFIPPDRFTVQNGTYYKDRVVLHVECSYSPELFDIPPGKQVAFSKLATLDVQEFLYNNLKYFLEQETAIARLSLKIDDWAEAASKREELLSAWQQKDSVITRGAVYFI